MINYFRLLTLFFPVLTLAKGELQSSLNNLEANLKMYSPGIPFAPVQNNVLNFQDEILLNSNNKKSRLNKRSIKEKGLRLLKEKNRKLSKNKENYDITPEFVEASNAALEECAEKVKQIVNFTIESLDTINSYRILHDSPLLKWNDELAEYAEHWAMQCAGDLSGGKDGECIGQNYSSIKDAIGAWYETKKFYKSRYTPEAATFTQMIWKNTSEVGCAEFYCNGENGIEGNFYVCEFRPVGNVPGYFSENVKILD